ncbi:alpha,alpha-trehalose-phosphate synthase (UDP-forming) [Salinarimonas chemoclinalis]|uniref:alpha,alpha-trehalose-phosphate synthase (UDP-forming) n=1 Tax=Salinarimonas chemoclinalis TaxID=3241599 RepID=UPI0035581D7F
MIRYGGLAVLIAGLVIVVLLPVATSFVESWSRRDVDLRSQLVFNAARSQIEDAWARGDAAALEALFGRIATDARIAAIGLCEDGTLTLATGGMPADFGCDAAPADGAAGPRPVTLNGETALVTAHLLSAPGEGDARLVVLHDLAFIEERAGQTRMALILALVGVGFGGAALASGLSILVLSRWRHSVRQAIEDVREGRTEDDAPSDTQIGEEIRSALGELELARRQIDTVHTIWNPDTLQVALANELPGSEVIVVSNREPYIHNRKDDGTIQVQRPASGLVSALEPVTRACGGTWIAHGSGSADREAVDEHDRVGVPPAKPSYTLRRLWLSDEEQDGYYYGFSNEGLWPLCHIAFVRPIFRESDWRLYRSVNERFAEAVVAEAKRPDPIVLIQDYHLALAPRMIRDRLPNATIITFWHIPWPNSETFGICPWKEEIIDGLLGSSILGFHTQFHCNNFLDTVDRFMESRIDRESDSISLGGHETFVRPYPISIDWPPAALEGQPPVPETRATVRERLGLAPDIRLGVGIERFDYTKGILDRMRGVDAFLEAFPDWKGRFCFAQVAAPTRAKLASYRNLQAEAEELAAQINARHGSDGWEPIKLLARHHEPDEVFELFRASDLCIVSSLHDGMNLVAKEFVAARDDEQGVLVLSAFAGASRELSEALIVNPYDADEMGRVIQRALTMDSAEQRERMKVMREQVEARNVYRWAGQMLLDAARLRKKERIMRLIEAKERRNGRPNERRRKPAA